MKTFEEQFPSLNGKVKTEKQVILGHAWCTDCMNMHRRYNYLENWLSVYVEDIEKNCLDKTRVKGWLVLNYGGNLNLAFEELGLED